MYNFSQQIYLLLINLGTTVHIVDKLFLNKSKTNNFGLI